MTEITQKAEIEIEKRKILQMSKISLWLNVYDDIFSDFDSRPFFERALSDDFLLEIKKASRDKKSGEIELRFLLHKESRNINHENLIRKRLKEHFKKHYIQLQEEIKSVKKRGLSIAIMGAAMISIATYLYTIDAKSLLLTFLETMLTAGGWFSGWTGLDEFFYTSRNIKPDLDFYEKMSKAEVIFMSY